MRNQILAAVSMAMLGACLGGGISSSGRGDDDDGTGESARALFDSNVAPVLTACVSCHVGPETSSTNMFLGDQGPTGYYDSLVKDRAVNGGFNPDAATILLKGAHEGPMWQPAQATKIAEWLRAELKERGGTDTGSNTVGNKTPRAAEMAFASCLSVSTPEYTTTQAFQVANMNTQQGRCTSCHNGGAGGQYLNTANQNKDMLAKWQQEVFFTGVFVANLQPDSTYKIGAAEVKICNKGKEKDNNLGQHPSFDCKQNGALDKLKLFATQVQAKVDAHDPTCPAPAFAAPTL